MPRKSRVSVTPKVIEFDLNDGFHHKEFSQMLISLNDQDLIDLLKVVVDTHQTIVEMGKAVISHQMQRLALRQAPVSRGDH